MHAKIVNIATMPSRVSLAKFERDAIQMCKMLIDLSAIGFCR